jgi:hypothetical protein
MLALHSGLPVLADGLRPGPRAWSATLQEEASMHRFALAALSFGALVAGTALPPAPALAQDHVAPITAMAPRLRALVAAVKAQNTRHASLTQADIDRLDKQWRAEVSASARPLITSVMAHPLSATLKAMQAGSNGLITEVFVMDNRGLNVGQSEVTSDYWQGDEAKFQRTFDVGPTALFVDKVEQDESTQEFQSQLSFTLVDPADGSKIGAVTIGLSIERLAQ